MKPIAFFFVFVALGLLLFIGCTQAEEKGENSKETKSVEEMCLELCKAEKAKGTDLSLGPCLSNNFHPDWVCDIAHSPRKKADNNPANQCSAFREGKANHFVEVSPECKFIKKW